MQQFGLPGAEESSTGHSAPAVPSPNLQILDDALGPSIINSATQMQGTDTIQFKSEVRKEN